MSPLDSEACTMKPLIFPLFALLTLTFYASSDAFNLQFN